jgi:hypothetical protein
MERLDIEGDARRVVQAVKAGGVALIPMDVGYAGIGGCQDALMRFFRAKGRGAHKRNAMLGNLDLHDELHLLDPRGRDMVRCLVEDHDLPIAAVAAVEVDYGLQKFHRYRRSSTMIDFRTMEVVRIGSCYEVIADVLQRHFGVGLPPDPGLDALPSGHLREAQQRYA